ncbi:hypothetical protein ScPMuIL_006885 [Solemya velum]
MGIGKRTSTPPLFIALCFVLFTRMALSDASTCDCPVSLPNTEVEYTELDVGSVAKYACLEGFSSAGGDTVEKVCQAGGQWSSDPLECIPDGCGEPELHPTAKIGPGSNSVGSVRTYSCDPFLNMEGPHGNIICQEDHTWSPARFTCTDQSLTMPGEKYCDGVQECSDWSDEWYCCLDLNTGQCNYDVRDFSKACFQCSSTGMCYSILIKCNGHDECGDMSDELSCCMDLDTNVCLPDRKKCFTCHDGSGCIPASMMCDGSAHCQDNSDELNCCSIEQFKCDNGQCVHTYYYCDDYPDCYADNSDENNCN